MKPDPRCIEVEIELPDGRHRQGFHEPWRSLVTWKELNPHPDEGDWYWAHAHESEVSFFPIVVECERCGRGMATQRLTQRIGGVECAGWWALCESCYLICLSGVG